MKKQKNPRFVKEAKNLNRKGEYRKCIREDKEAFRRNPANNSAAVLKFFGIIN